MSQNPEALGGVVPVQAGGPSGPISPGVNIGDVLYWNGAVWVPQAPGVDGQQLTTHGVGLPPTWEAASVLPIGYLRGCALSWTSVTQVGIATGRAHDENVDFDIEVMAPLTADITVVGANGLDAGVEAPSTWYAVYVIADSTGANPVASLLATSFVIPALPIGYDRYRRVGCVRNDAGSNFIPFAQVWNTTTRRYYLDLTPATSQVLAGGAAAAFTDVALAAFVPPTAFNALLLAEFAAGVLGAIGDELHIRPNGFSASATAAPIVVRALVALATKSAQEVICACPGQIVEYRVSNTLLNSADISVIGFDDEL